MEARNLKKMDLGGTSGEFPFSGGDSDVFHKLLIGEERAAVWFQPAAVWKKNKKREKMLNRRCFSKGVP